MSENGKKKSIGILGGMGPLATADLFRRIVELTDAKSDNDHIRIFIDNNTRIPDRTAAILSGGEDPLPHMTESLQKLVLAGADFIVMPCNTAHFFLPRLKAKSPVPFLSILDATAEAASRRFPGQTAAILATRGTIRTGLYQDALEERHLPYMIPDDAEQEALMQVIYDGVKAGNSPEIYGEGFSRVLSSMRERGADYFILGCTELPVAAQAVRPDVPLLDPTEELAKAAIRYAGYSIR